jgi:hypothetical protein
MEHSLLEATIIGATDHGVESGPSRVESVSLATNASGSGGAPGRVSLATKV